MLFRSYVELLWESRAAKFLLGIPTAGAVLGAIFNSDNALLWVAVLLGGVVLAQGWMGVQWVASRPRLEFDDARFDDRQEVHDLTGHLGGAWILRTSIRNAANAGPAEDAHAWLRFLDLDHNPISQKYRLRWVDEPKKPIITLAPNDYPYDIDIGLRFTDGGGVGSLYVWSMDSVTEGVRRGDGKYRIDEDEFLIEITVRGKGFTKRQIRQVWPLKVSPQVFEEGHAPGT